MPPRTVGLRPWAPRLALALALVTPRAHAQTASEIATRDELLRQAHTARGNGQHEAAVALVLRAQRIATTPSTQVLLVGEYRALGRLAEAYEAAFACANGPAPSSVPERRAHTECHTATTQLRPLLAAVTIHVTEPAPEGVTVRIENRVLSPAQLGAPVFVTPGSMQLIATAENRAPFTQTLALAAGERRDVSLVFEQSAPPSVDDSGLIAALPRRSAPAPTATPASTTPLATPSPEAPREQSVQANPWSNPLTVLSLASIVVGATAGAAGGVLLALRESAAHEYNAAYQAGTCAGADVPSDTAACRELVSRGETLGGASVALLVAGGVFVGVGFTGYVLTRMSPSPRRERVAPSDGVPPAPANARPAFELTYRCAPGVTFAGCAAELRF